jgi:hypothetical protein
MADEFRRYQRDAGRRAKRRVRRAFWRRVEHGLPNKDYIRIESFLQMGHQIVNRVQHYLDEPAPNFAREIGKVSYGVNLVLRLAQLGLAVYLLAIAVDGGWALLTGRPIELPSVFADVAANRWYHVGFAALALVLINKAVRKFREPSSD